MQAVEHPIDPEELNEYLDGELPLDRAAIVEAHVAGCAACQKLTADLRRVSRELGEWTVEKSPATLRASGPLVDEPAPTSWRPRWLSSVATFPVLGLTGVVVLVVLVAGTSNRMEKGGVALVRLGGTSSDASTERAFS